MLFLKGVDKYMVYLHEFSAQRFFARISLLHLVQRASVRDTKKPRGHLRLCITIVGFETLNLEINCYRCLIG